ncbi:hypothetical protein B0T11DRAFT_118718 [Plectosphaerella cucumerina]|uniref:Uncharacterized protein n=1 Tax=Plectosphaerella cucumerina TaxID=40658 RepID=A0A8K0T9S6_9PEZI|nr:hypothetical protein B0T11DRAFT_118718 [Plectosphaerella cucumerina]
MPCATLAYPTQPSAPRHPTVAFSNCHAVNPGIFYSHCIFNDCRSAHGPPRGAVCPASLRPGAQGVRSPRPRRVCALIRNVGPTDSKNSPEAAHCPPKVPAPGARPAAATVEPFLSLFPPTNTGSPRARRSLFRDGPCGCQARRRSRQTLRPNLSSSTYTQFEVSKTSQARSPPLLAGIIVTLALNFCNSKCFEPRPNHRL